MTSKRILSTLLALLMIATVIPFSVFIASARTAAGETVLIAFSDFQDPGGNSQSASNVTAILNSIKTAYSSVDGLLFCGDVDKNLPSTNVQQSINALNSAVNSVYPSMPTTTRYFVQGNHDQVTQGTNGLTGPGAHDADDYGVFIIDEDDYQWGNGADAARIQQTAANLESYLNNKVSEVYSKPIFVLSHVPLHFSSRTSQGDGKYAKYLFDVLNAAGAEGLNIIFLYGHDHSNGWDNHLGGAAVYLPVGENINIAELGSGSSFTTNTLNFTYMNAGFVGYYADKEPENSNTTGVDDALTMSVFVITDNSVTIKRYDANGVHNLKSAGVNRLSSLGGDFSGCELNTTVYPSPQTVEIGTAVEFIDESTLVKVKTRSGDSLNISENTAFTTTDNRIEKYKAYDISVHGFVNGSTATVSIPVPEEYDTGRVHVYYAGAQGLEDMKATVVDGYAVFKTTHFSTYLVAENKEAVIDSWTEITHFAVSDAVTTVHDGDQVYIRNVRESSLYLSNNLQNNKFQLVAEGSAYPWTVEIADGKAYLKNSSGDYMYVDGETVGCGGENRATLTYLSSASAWEIQGATKTVTDITEERPNGTYKYNSETVRYSSSGSYSTYTNGNYYFNENNNYYPVTGITWEHPNGNKYSLTIKYSGGNKEYSSDSTKDLTSYTLYTRVENTTTVKVGETITYTPNGQHLNQYGGTTQAAGYSVGAATDSGSRWTLYKLAPAPSTYVGMSGDKVYEFATGEYSDSASLERYIKNHVSVYAADDTNGTNIREVAYTLSGTANPNAAGNYTYNVVYNDPQKGNVTVDTVTVRIKDKQITNITVDPMSGSMVRSNSTVAKTGAKLTVHYSDGTTSTVDVTSGMLSGENLNTNVAGTYENLTVSYGGKTVGGFTLEVRSKPGEVDYPEYPNGGSVRVDKSGRGIDFTSTGIAQIELSAAGIPVNSGVDVIFMLDTSSSMTFGDSDGTTAVAVGSQRIDMLHTALTEALTEFQKPREDGSPSDIRVAIADFNSYTQIDTANKVGSSQTNKDDHGSVFTGDGAIDAGAFVNVNSITNISSLVNSIVTKSGTNYDYAFDTVYRLGQAIQEQNAQNGETRDLYVIFMSDGTPFQYNYYTSTSSNADWNYWLRGEMVEENKTIDGNNTYFYNGSGNSHRMADAIKGNPDDDFEVIDPTNSLGTASESGKNYMRTVHGLGATMYSVGFCIYADNQITQQTTQHVISNLASVKDGERLYYDARNEAQLTEAFTQITSSISYAATNARFIDTLGANYDIQLKTVNYAKNNTAKTIAPEMVFKMYDVYQSSEIGEQKSDRTTITAADIGKRKDSGNIVERVWFNAEGTQAFSDQVNNGTTNIFVDGLIKAKNFWYNTTDTALPIATKEAGTYLLAPETFYWSLGTCPGAMEAALSYYVYLTGSMEGTRPEGSYPTNESAVLYYTNWLDHDSHLATISPILPWGAANVSYAFYLVDDYGNPVVNRTTGQTGSFTNRVVLTNPVVYSEIMLNSAAALEAISLEAKDVVPEGYELFDERAAYEVYVSSDGENSYWELSHGEDVDTSYVTGYGGDPSQETRAENVGYDYTHTVVWFAVRFSIKAVPDIVVIDFGIPVDINVIDNDMFGGYGTVEYVGAGTEPGQKTVAVAPGFANTISTTYGLATVKDGKIRYTPATMQMSGIDTFLYAARYDNTDSDATENNGYYYSYVKVVPATTIYYEDKNEGAEFVTFTGEWTEVGAENNAAQEQDIPGTYSKINDANNVYGYDPAYGNSITYSLGRAKKATVRPLKSGESWPSAEFTFTGTGFDVLSVTNNATGFIRVQVYNSTGALIKTWAVDTFYGFSDVRGTEKYYKCDWLYNNGAWHVERTELTEKEDIKYAKEHLNNKLPSSPAEGDTRITYELDYDWANSVSQTAGSLYQVPVIKSYDTLDYGTYRVVITPMYSKLFDHTGGQSYDYYFDSIRIYNPAGITDPDVNKVYMQDNEAYPQFIDLREMLINADSFGTIAEDDAATSGAVFIDAFGTDGDISQYANYGPNNEIYLQPGQAVAFAIESNGSASNIASVQIGAKCVVGATSFSINGKSYALATSTDMYYKATDLIKWNEDGSSNVIIIMNTGSDLVSLTTMKITYKTDPNASSETPDQQAPAKAALFMSRSMASAAVQSVYASYTASITEPAKPIESTEPSGDNGGDNGGDVTLPDAFIPYVRRDTGSTEKPPVSDRPGTFVPTKFEVSFAKTKASAGQTIRMTIVTSSDVAAVWVDGEKATLFNTDKKTGEKTFRYVVTCTHMGEMTVSAVAYDAEGVSSRALENIIKVTANKNK